MIRGTDLDAFYLGLARYVSRLGTCPAKKVGAVLVHTDLDAVLSVGYNAAPRGTPPCGEECKNREIGENSKACRAIHAEVTAILNAAYVGTSIKGARLYVTISPCQSCARSIIQSGISEVVVSGLSPYTKAIDLLDSAGVGMRVLSGITVPQVSVAAD